jgi:opacity protein-like surface antigen
MKKVLLILLLLAIFVGFSVSTSFADLYISGNIGSVILNDADIDNDGDDGELAFDSGILATFAVGTAIGSAGRVEAEIGYRQNDLDKMEFDDKGSFSLEDGGDVTATFLMGNGYYDFKNGSHFTPFIGGGLGFANVEYDLDSMDGKEDDNVMAYQLILGVGFAATEQLSIDLQYRYFATADPEIDGSDVEYQTHNIMLGLRYSF